VVHAWKAEHNEQGSLDLAILCELVPEFCSDAQGALVKDGYTFVVTVDPQTGGFLVTAQPVLPGKTGLLNLIADGSGGFRAVLHPAAMETQRKMFEELRRRGERVISNLVANIAPRLRSALGRPKNLSTAEAFQRLNTNGDDVLALDEIQAYPVLDLGQSLGDLLNLREIMGLGAGGESLLGLSVGLFDLTLCDWGRGAEQDGDHETIESGGRN
jgi:hypothetical protein